MYDVLLKYILVGDDVDVLLHSMQIFPLSTNLNI